MADVNLVERAARGDRDAFDALVSEAIDRLYGMARLILRDADMAEDAVQDALIHCWRELPRLRDAATFDSWLNRVLVNSATDQHRRSRRFQALVSVLPAGRVEPDFSLDVAIADELRGAFERLRMEHRVVLILHHYIGLSVPEIGATLGVPSGTVKSRLHYAAESMRAAVEAGMRSTAMSAAEVRR